MAEDGLVLGIDAVFAVEQGGEFVIDKAAEAVGLMGLMSRDCAILRMAGKKASPSRIYSTG